MAVGDTHSGEAKRVTHDRELVDNTTLVALNVAAAPFSLSILTAELLAGADAPVTPAGHPAYDKNTESIDATIDRRQLIPSRTLESQATCLLGQ